MKANAKKLLPVLIITVALIFSISLTGCSFGPFDIDFGFDESSDFGSDRVAFGITVTVNETSVLGYGIETGSNLDGSADRISVMMLAANTDKDDPSADFFNAQVFIPKTEESNPSYSLLWGSMDSDYTVDQTLFASNGDDTHYESDTDISVSRSYLTSIVYFFNSIMDN